MTYHGRFKNGVVVFDAPPDLPENAAVEVAAVEAVNESSAQRTGAPSWAEVLEEFIGKVDGLPPDLARNHDHYIHGSRKR